MVHKQVPLEQDPCAVHLASQALMLQRSPCQPSWQAQWPDSQLPCGPQSMLQRSVKDKTMIRSPVRIPSSAITFKKNDRRWPANTHPSECRYLFTYQVIIMISCSTAVLMSKMSWVRIPVVLAVAYCFLILVHQICP